jgi:hypothetical protein
MPLAVAARAISSCDARRRRLGERDVQHFFDEVEGNGVQPLEHLEGHGVHRVRVERDVREVDVRKIVLRGERAAPDRDEAISHG